jgi:hypothetical protein
MGSGGASTQAEGWGSRIQGVCLCRASSRLMASTGSVFDPEILDKSPAYAALVVGYMKDFLAFGQPKAPYSIKLNSG